MGWQGVRFPNPKSDVDQFVDMIGPLAEDFDDGPFGLDQMRDSLVSRGLISASGATGSRAVARSVAKAGAGRSTRDLSRDSLYNQCKMMSEVYRALGWFRSLPGHRLRFHLTNLGLTLAQYSGAHGQAFVRGAFRESLLGVVFPNATTKNVGVKNSRPFAWMLRVANALDGMICRDEIIFGAQSVSDDLAPGEFDAVVDRIRELRGGRYAGLAAAVQGLAERDGVQVNTLKNYTRIPNRVMSSSAVGWGEIATDTSLYGRKGLPVYVLSADAIRTARELPLRADVRESLLNELSLDEATTFADYGYFKLLAQAGMPPALIQSEVTALAPEVQPLLERLGLTPTTPLLFNPELQVSDAVLAAAAE